MNADFAKEQIPKARNAVAWHGEQAFRAEQACGYYTARGQWAAAQHAYQAHQQHLMCQSHAQHAVGVYEHVARWMEPPSLTLPPTAQATACVSPMNGQSMLTT